MLNYILVPGAMAVLGFAHRSSEVGDCEDKDTTVKGICVLNSEPGETARGVVHFEQANEHAKTHIHGEFVNLTKNHLHGFHIHAFGNLTKGCVTAGPHYNPHGKEHGGPFSSVRHVGDLGNVYANDKGEATFDHQDSQISLIGQRSVIGRACVLHKFTDDHGYGGNAESKETGNAGPRIA